MALFSISCLGGAVVPMLIGVFAERVGLCATMWLLLLGPVSLLVGIRRRHIIQDEVRAME